MCCHFQVLKAALQESEVIFWTYRTVLLTFALTQLVIISINTNDQPLQYCLNIYIEVFSQK